MNRCPFVGHEPAVDPEIARGNSSPTINSTHALSGRGWHCGHGRSCPQEKEQGGGVGNPRYATAGRRGCRPLGSPSRSCRSCSARRVESPRAGGLEYADVPGRRRRGTRCRQVPRAVEGCCLDHLPDGCAIAISAPALHNHSNVSDSCGSRIPMAIAATDHPWRRRPRLLRNEPQGQ